MACAGSRPSCSQTAANTAPQEEDFQDPDHFTTVPFEELFRNMKEAFPNIPPKVVRKVVYAQGKDPGVVVDELLRLDGGCDTGSMERSCNPVEQVGSVSRSPCYDDQSSAGKVAKLTDDGAKAAGDFDVAEYLTVKEMMVARAEFFRGFLPDASPDYLEEQATNFGENELEIREWLDKMMRDRSYPKLIDYLKDKEFRDTLSPFKSMTAEEFLELVPNPAATFDTTDRIVTDVYKADVERMLLSLFPALIRPSPQLTSGLQAGNHLLVPTVKVFEARGLVKQPPPDMSTFFMKNRPIDTTFLHEFTYVRLKDEILSLLTVRDEQLKILFEEARAAGTLVACRICLEEVLPFDVISCADGHGFCSKCVAKQAEVTAASNRPRVICLLGPVEGCDAAFALPDLEPVVSASSFARIRREFQEEQLRSAGMIDSMEECPFCDFRAIVEDPKLTVFRCMKCRVDSCRKCKDKEHGAGVCPIKESSNQVKARVMLEEKLADAVIRMCPRCKKKVIKASGCNHMACECGANFCYRCRRPLQPNTNCPKPECLEVTEAERIHTADLQQAAKEGRSAVARDFAGIQLAVDPTKDIAGNEQ